MDGARFSRCFDANSDDWRILPSIDLIEKEFPEYAPCQHAAIRDIILDTGIAYMVNPYEYDNVRCAEYNCHAKSDHKIVGIHPTILWYDISGAPGGAELFCNYKQTVATNGV
jgi:hypothetical protein